MASLSKQNAQDLALKLRFESQLAISMRRFFKDISEEARAYYKETEQLLDLRRFDTELATILRQHYRKVSRVFDSRLREDLQKKFNILETKAADDKIKTRLNNYFFRRSVEQTNIISQTNTSELFTAFQKTMVTAAVTGKHLRKDELADEAMGDFDDRALGRAGTIGLTETQNAAEKTKDIEAEGLIDSDVVIAGGVLLSEENITKTWSAILDNRTRIAHAEADDQTVPQDEPFIVDKESLMFPGDDSMGASLENIINCRCNTTRAVELAELPEFVEHPENRAPRRGNVFFPE